MFLNEYQEMSRDTAIYPDKDDVGGLIYAALGLNGEAGEVAENVKKMLRDDNGLLTLERRRKFEKELGDVLWYLAQLATELELDLDDVAAANLAKLNSRRERGVLSGDGDER